MKQTVNFSAFCDAFARSQYKSNFSYAGLINLFDYLEDYELSRSEELELDIVALCCDFTEYESLQEFQQDYSDSYESIEDIQDDTTVIMVDEDSFIVQNF